MNPTALHVDFPASCGPWWHPHSMLLPPGIIPWFRVVRIQRLPRFEDWLLFHGVVFRKGCLCSVLSQKRRPDGDVRFCRSCTSESEWSGRTQGIDMSIHSWSTYKLHTCACSQKVLMCPLMPTLPTLAYYLGSVLPMRASAGIGLN